MRSHSRRWQLFAFPALSGLIFGLVLAPVEAGHPANAGHAANAGGQGSRDPQLTRSINLVRAGDFDAAAKELEGLEHAEGVTAKVRDWLLEFKALQDQRRELDREDFEKYEGYAKARIEREEYRHALPWIRRAAGVAENKDAFLSSDWVRRLVASALKEANLRREAHNWIPAYSVYSNLADLYEREPRYRKLENEVLTHLRLDVMFDKKGRWRERLEHIRWNDAEDVLGYIERWYFAGPGKRTDFRKIAASGLEQLLILADSPSAREVLADTTRLDDEFDRADFKARITKNLEDIREASSVNQRTARRHFRRALKINRETIKLPEDLVVSELMRGALDPLDDYTTIIWPAEAEEFDKHTRGDFVGVGISIVKNMRTDEIEVSSPMANTPAYEAGVLPGDIITHVNGATLKGFSLSKTVRTIVGPANTEVTLTMRREGKSFDLVLMRKVIKIPSVMGIARREDDPQEWNHWIDRENNIAYIRVASFQGNTVEDLDNVISELKADGAQALILDLRGNPGGLLTSAQRMVSLFMGRGEPVVSTKGQIPRENQDYVTKFDGPHKNIPLTVLVDAHSASASEIVSGAIRDNHRGVVIGERTFGKFSVQNLIPLGTSGKAKLKLTTARYYLPSGDSLHRDEGATTWGVEPDVTVRLATKEKFRIWEMRREADRIGPAPKAFVDAEEETGEDAGNDAEKPQELEEPQEPEEPELTWFTLNDKSVYDMTVKNKEDTEVFDHVNIKDQSVETLAKTDNGDEVTIKTMRIEGDQIGVAAWGPYGKHFFGLGNLLVAGHEATLNKLPRLVQKDENTRPHVDPQRDAALLQMRVMLLSESYPAVVAANRSQQTETATP